MNLQHKTHSMAKAFLKYAAYGAILILALWSWNAEASPGAYEPAPKLTEIVINQIANSCLRQERLVLPVRDENGNVVYLTFLCQLKFISDKPPEKKS